MSLDDCKTNNPRIDEEHKNLHRMLSSLRAVVVAGHDPQLIIEAISVMKERMKLHFQAEESEAQGCSGHALLGLQQDHKALLETLEKLRAAASEPVAIRKEALNEFMAALDRHDREVDRPFFHKGP
jgi:hemerythrin-like metal-binding protein